MTVLPPDPRSTASAIASAPRADDASAGVVAGARRSASPSAPAGDRVELSAEGRAQSAEGDPVESAEMAGARVALRAGSRLSPARLHELREQVRTGHYDTPEAIERIASAAADDLAPKSV